MSQGARTEDEPTDLPNALSAVRACFDEGHVRFVAEDASRLVPEVLDVINATAGLLNFNDALLVVLDREGTIDELASFDPGFDSVPEFRRIS